MKRRHHDPEADAIPTVTDLAYDALAEWLDALPEEALPLLVAGRFDATAWARQELARLANIRGVAAVA